MRAATCDLHDDLDRSFAALDLARPDGFDRFLEVHQAALMAIAPSFERFVANELAMTPPDYPAMLSADLGGTLPRAAAAPEALDGLGATYVVAGSRLGLSVLRKRGFARPSRYMEDRAGLDVWRALLGWMERQPSDAARIESAAASAMAGFAVYSAALQDVTARTAGALA